MPSKYNVASLFAGIGGICLGFKEAGADIVWANEIDKYACHLAGFSLNP
ncbi:MAG: DNA cytosine methyltransferase [Candidatus Methanomethylophilaceae archaeon]|nr:DNA cytosine methyltransferase [Candidatus Methanomethylophilaceae archaeon]